MANSGRFEYTIGFRTDDSGLKSARKALQEIQNLTVDSPGLKNMDSELAIAKTRAAELETALTKAFNVKLGTTSVTALNKQLKSLDLKAIYKDLAAIGPKGEEAFNKMAAQALKSNIQIKETDTLMKKFGATLWNNISWMVSGGIINSILGVFQQAYGYTKNLDESLNNIRIVTGQGADEMERFAATAQDAAKELGKGTTDYTNAALIFYQQGLGAEETKARTDIATKIANTSGQSVESAADEMTAVWNGYQVATNELELYGDKIAAVAASTASNTQELATGISKVASAANTAGIDIDQLNSMLSTVISVTREAPESVGTAFKTIFARIGDLVEDGTDEFGVTLGQISTHLHAMGIDILDEQGKMRDMGEVIEEVGNNWNNYSREQQQAIAIQMAGKRQYNQLISLFSNWDKYTTSLETSQNALGKLQEQQDIFMESVPAKLQQVRTSWEGVYDSILDSDSIVTVADLISGLLEKVESFFDSVGGGLPMLQMLASTMLQIFSDKIGVQLGIAVSNFGIIRDRMAEITAEQEIQSRFGSIDNTTTQTLVEQTEQILEYRSAMTKEQQDEYNKLLDEEVEQQTKLKILQEQLETLEQLKIKWDIPSGIDPLELKNKIKALQDVVKNNAIDGQELFSKIPKDLEPVNGAFGNFKTYVESVRTKLQELSQQVGEKGPIADLATQWGNAVSQLQQGGWDQELVTRFERMASSINVVARDGAQELQQIFQTNTDQLRNQVQQQEQVVQSQGAIFESLIQRLKAQNLGQAMSQIASSVGQVISSIQMLKNIGSIWENDDLSKSEKMLQTVQNLAFTVPMLMNSLKGLTAVTKLFNIEQAKSAVEGLRNLNIELKRNSASIKGQIERVKELALQKAQTTSEVAEAGAVEVETGAETANTAAKMANSAATGAQILVTLAYAAVILGIVATLAGLAYGWYKVIQAQKEADEANQKAIDTADELKTKYKDLIDSNYELIASFSEYESVWENWKKGAIAVDEVDSSMTSLIETLGMMNDPEMKDALNQARVSGYYDEVNDLIEKQEQRIKESVVNAKKALLELEKISQEQELIESGKKTYTVGNDVANYLRETIPEEIRRLGGFSIGRHGYKDEGKVTIDSSKMSPGDYEAFTADNGQWIKDAMQEAYENYQSASSEGIKKMASQAYNFYSELYSSVFGAHKAAIEDAEKEVSHTEIGLELFGDIDSSTSEEEVIEKAKEYQTRLEEIGEEVSLGDAMTQAFEFSPTEAVEKVNALFGITEEQFNKKIEEWNNNNSDEDIDFRLFKDEDMIEIQNQFKNFGLDINKLDLSTLDTDLVLDILAAVGNNEVFSEELINKIKRETSDTSEQISNLDIDFQSLGSSMESVGEKIEKGMSPTTLSKNKDYQSIIEQTEQLKEIYYEDGGLIDAIDIISNPNLVGTQQFAEAWEKVQQQVKNADIEASLDRYKNLLEEFTEEKTYSSGEEAVYLHLESDEFIEQMNDLTAADYQVDVAVQASIENSVEEAKSDMKEMVDAAAKIGENFIVSTDDLDTLSEKFPGILEGMTTLADGSIQLNEAAVKKAKEVAEENIKTETQEQVEKLKLQNVLLEEKAKTYDSMMDIANQMAKGDFETEKDLTDALSALEQGELEVKELNQKEEAIAEGNMAKESAENWERYYTHLSEIDANFWRQRLRNSQATSENDVKTAEITGQLLITHSVPGATYKTVDIDQEIEVGKRLQEQYEARRKQIEDQIKENERLIQILEATSQSSINSIDTAGKATEATDKNTDSKEKNADATNKQSEATAKLLDLLEDEIDAYHDINIAIQQVDAALSRLQKQQEKLTGQDLLDNLAKQNDLLEQQRINYEEKIRLSKADLALTRIQLETAGAEFNENGTLNNYSELLQSRLAYVQGLQSQYNSMSATEQEGFEDVVEQAKEEYETLKDNIEKYEQLLLEDIPDLEDQIRDAYDQQIELHITAFDTKIQVQLDFAQAEKDMREFRKKVIDQLKEDDILGNAIADYQDISYYRNDNGAGIIQVYTKALEEINQAVNEIEAGGTSAIYGDNLAAAQEAQREMQENLRNALMEERDLVDQIQEAYLSMIDKAQEKFDEQIESYNKLSSLINHDMNIIKLLYGEDKAYAMLEKYYQKQNEYNAQQMDMYMKQAEYWKQEMENAEKGSEAWKKFKENYENAVESSKESLETSIQGVIDTYVNAIDKIFLELEEKITGGLGMDRLKKDWDFLNNESDKYLDTINGAYEIQKLEQQMKEKIAETDDLATQRQLTDVMNEQLETLRERDKITQYDVDRANALFDIEVKKAAFRDAQQNKSKMRLRRDSQGNYSYQFVSDEDQVAQAAQELADAQNSLYNLDKDAYKNNLDQIQAIWVEWAEELATIENDSTLEHEEKERRREELALKYNEAILNLTHQNEQIRLNLMDSTFQSLANMYNTDVEYYQNMSDAEKNILMEQMVPAWGSAMQQMATLIGQEGLMGIMQEAFDEMDEASADFDNQLAAIADRAGGYFDFIKSGEDLIVEGMERMMDTNDAVLNQWEEMVETMKQLAASALTLADGLTQISQDAVDALKNLRDLDDYQAEQEIEDAANNAEDKANDAMGNNDDNANNNGLDYNRDDWGDGEFPQIGDKVTYLGDPYYYDSYGTNPSGTRGAGQNKTVTVTHLAKKNAYPVHVQSSDAAYGWLKKYQIAKMDTGGYTGDWDSKEGRLGILHEKELVLNKFDSQAFLDLVDRFKMWFKLNDIRQHWEQNLQEAMLESEVLESMRRMRQAYDSSLDNIQPIVNITAEFPDATDAQEIQTAFENLVNHATQIARSKLR